MSVALALAMAGASIAPALATPGAAAITPQERLANTLHDQKVALRHQLNQRGAREPVASPAIRGAIVVSNCDDSGAGSLRAALGNAVSGDVIDLTSLTCSPITLTTGALTTTADDVTVAGPGRDLLAIDGGNRDRVIEHVSYYGTLTLGGLTIRDGSYVYSGPGIYASAAPGGCVFSRSNLTITDSAIEHCSASGKSVQGAAVDAFGGLILTDSTITGAAATALSNDISATIYGGIVAASVAYLTRATISDSTVSASSTAAFSGVLGGGLFAMYGAVLTDSTVTGITTQVTAGIEAYAKGSGIGSPTTVILSGSTISNNVVHGTPGSIGGGGIYLMSIPRGLPVPSSITNSTISGNAAMCDCTPDASTLGGGGGLATWARVPVTITNSTVSGNNTNLNGGGLYTRHDGAFVLASSTITDNTSPSGSGISVTGDVSPFDLVTDSSIIAGNHAPDGTTTTDIVTTHPISGAHNLIASANAPLPGDTLGDDPMLGPLADNGGPTLTHALLAGSPAIDTGANGSNLTTDQRGDGYVRVSGAAADIGAFESQPVPDVIFANGFD